MRKPSTIFLLFFLAFSSSAQISLEHTYTGSVYIADLKENGYKYYDMDVVLNQCRLYNLDHSLWKSIQLDVPQDHYLYDVRYVSLDLFNMDELVELAYTYYEYNDVDSFYTYTTNIINEEGTLLLEVPGAYYSEVVSNGNDAYKFLAYVWDFSVYPSTLETSVYALPGQAGNVHEQSPEPILGEIFPNPGNDQIMLPVLPGQKIKQLQLLNVQGKLIREFQPAPRNSTLKMDVGELEKGTYFIRVLNMKNQVQIKKLIIS
ncbi:MAG: T9SS type A sorting domain-containing protein [Bacteroidota bacterium]|nr:T9SS type A sorting domain-containing protein [Bacteroidota bacterium]